MSSLVFDCMYVCGDQHLIKKANVLNRFTIQGVERWTNDFLLLSLKLSIDFLTSILNTLIVRWNISFVDLFKEADSRSDMAIWLLFLGVCQETP